MGELRVRGEQVRGLLRLVAEARELRGDGDARAQHVLMGMTRLIGCRVAAVVEVDDFRPGGVGRIRAVPARCGCDDNDLRLVMAPMLEQGSIVEPTLDRLMRGAGDATIRRREVVSDREWYRAPFVMERRRLAALDDTIVSYRRSDAPDRGRGLCFNRPWGDRPFSEEERDLVRLLHEECAWLFSAPDPLGRAGARLSPRERRTLSLLLAGASEKEIALALALSAHTVHQYVKALYRKLGVRSRGELLARFVA